MLRPSARSAAGYRRYSAEDATRLARICRYRRAGLPLDVIRDLLDAPEADGAEALTEVLADRLETLNGEIRHLREQQRFIVAYLLQDGSSDQTVRRGLAVRPFLTADRFVELLEVAGVSPERRMIWHAEFERRAAAEHQAFLEFLCLPDDAIRRIRQGPHQQTSPVPNQQGRQGSDQQTH